MGDACVLEIYFLRPRVVLQVLQMIFSIPVGEEFSSKLQRLHRKSP